MKNVTEVKNERLPLLTAIKKAKKGKKTGKLYFTPSITNKKIVLDKGYEGDEILENCLYEGTLKDFGTFMTFRPKFKLSAFDSYNKLNTQIDQLNKNFEEDIKGIKTFFDNIFTGIDINEYKYDLISEISFRVKESHKMYMNAINRIQNDIENLLKME